MPAGHVVETSEGHEVARGVSSVEDVGESEKVPAAHGEHTRSFVAVAATE